MELLLQLVLSLVALIGLAVSIIGLPGSIIIFLVLLTLALVSSFTLATEFHLLWFGAIIMFSLFADNLLVVFGARKHGASKYGMLGAFLGGIVGVLSMGPFGIIIGPFVGAILLEFVFNPNFKKAFEAGIGTFMGFLFGIVLKFVISIGLFIWLMSLIW